MTMDDFQPAGALGILYAEDFDIEPPPPPIAPPPPPAPPPITQADIDSACIRAVRNAEAAWSASAATQRAQALDSIAASLASAQADVATHAEAVADGIARTALGMLAGALPKLCQTHGDAEVRTLLNHLLPILAPRTKVVVRVHAALIPALRDDFAALDDRIATPIELRPANLPPGDVRVTWEDGNLERDATKICAAMREGLVTLGLLDPDPLTGA